MLARRTDSTVKAKRSAGNARKKQIRPKKPLRPGQPTPNSILDAELTKRLCGFIARGLVYETCAKLCEISPRAFYEWMAHGQTNVDQGRANTAYANFYRAVEKANAQGELVLHEAAVVSSPWQVLSRRFPSHYPSEKMQLELSGRDGKAIEVNAGVNVVVEASSSAANGNNLTPFSDERPGSPWRDRVGLQTDSGGHIFDSVGVLIGVVRNLPPEISQRPPGASQTPSPGVRSAPTSVSSSNAERSVLERDLADLKRQLAELKSAVPPSNGVDGRLRQLIR